VIKISLFALFRGIIVVYSSLRYIMRKYLNSESFMYKPGDGYSNDSTVKCECLLTDTRQKVSLRGTCISVCENDIFFFREV